MVKGCSISFEIVIKDVKLLPKNATIVWKCDMYTLEPQGIFILEIDSSLTDILQLCRET